ncbi:FAD:protein FMN transferase [Leptotrichia sp. oral taxon 218]|jgi:putative thiamine biosynthesis lipoprotein apbE|uniref:FAD:protein FMN transferase n=1 Tax=Leptotrichia sp. oral taxon 218 TaxID=712361 RepID=UPI001B8C70D7|nr:FAD:protein FMN transferase [Leptotrichia sp. oral taxon 218]QUB94956.1 FAD:protein FMN transferase [Leptotrichia sp. oral taxon 218]
MEKEYKVQTRFLFHTNIKIKIPDSFENKVFDELFEILEDVNKNYNSYSKNSYIDKINKNNGKFVQVNEETVNLLEKVVHFSEIMNGEYDITIMPLIKLWGFYKENSDKIPENLEIKKIKKLVDYKKIIIDKKNLKVKIDKNQEIITGSFIKAYAIDKAIQKMKELKIDDAIINAGGSSIAAINGWGIIVENPEPEKKLLKNDDGKILKITKEKYEGNDEYNDLFEIEIKDLTYSTSNQVNTFLEIDGEKYGHIISPKTGFPAKNKQIGIITENAFFGDMISTRLYNQTPKNFHEIIKKLSKEIKIEGYLIDENGEIHYTDGFLEYVK